MIPTRVTFPVFDTFHVYMYVSTLPAAAVTSHLQAQVLSLVAEILTHSMFAKLTLLANQNG